MISFPNANGNGRRPPPRGLMLCPSCNRAIARIRSASGVWDGPRPELFEYQQRNDRWAGSHHSQDGEFVAAIQMGCHLCHPIFESSPSRLRPFAKFFHTFYEIRRSGNERWSVQFTIELTESISQFGVEPQVIECYGTFKIIPRNTIRKSSGDFGRLTKDISSRACKKQVQSWFATCCINHHTCKEDWRTNSEHPMRLLNIKGDQMRLQCFETGETRPRYVTMSHRWDYREGVSTLRLGTENIDDFRAGFELSALPKHFRDAAEIAGWIGISYIWIDALCIVQDSNEDWEQQSRYMGDIYAGSYCNIAATDDNESTGCLKERRLEVIEPFYISHPEQQSSQLTHVIGYDDIWCNSLLNTSLHNRAWVLQERQLSPRTIHFGEQMFWECRSHKACEAYPEGIPPEFSNCRTQAWRQGDQIFKIQNRLHCRPQSTWLGFFFGLFRPRKVNPIPQSIPREEVYTTWSIIVQRYMECSLTKPSDKLVAIFGVAKKVHEITGDRYLAGLWQNEGLATGLLWYIAARKQAGGGPSIKFPCFGAEGFRAPSWSWASVDAKISWNWPAKCGKLLINVEKTVIHTAEEPGLRAVEGAEMQLRGCLIPARLQILRTEEEGRLDEESSYALLPRSGDLAADEEFEWLADFSLDSEPTIYLDEAMAPQPAMDVHLLPVCTEWRGRSGRIVADVAGLILHQRQLGTRTVYDRVGVYGLDRSSFRFIVHPRGEHRDALDGISESLLKESLTLV